MRLHPQPTPTPVAPLPLPKGWRKASLISDGQRYPFIYNPRARRVHAPGFPHLPLYRIRLHTGKIISQEDLCWDVENALGYDPGDDGSGPRRPWPFKPATPSS
jgi:hypothetical protein